MASQHFGMLAHSNEKKAKNEGVFPETNFKNPSIMYFTYYRCGSQFMKKILHQLEDDNTPKVLDYEAYLFFNKKITGNILENYHLFEKSFPLKGYLFGPLYHCLDKLFQIKEFKQFCILRDPRDVLVSHYFSLGFSHTITDIDASERRKNVASMTIDEFVLSPKYLDEIMDRYSKYLNVFKVADLNRPLYLYEDMISSFPVFLESLVDYMQINVAATKLAEILNEDHFKVIKEDKLSHKRCGSWGQFKGKLKKETIVELEKKLGNILVPWQKMNL